MDILKVAVVSDIHIGHAKNKAIEIIANLKKAFPDNAETGELDIIFLAGDVFDTLLSLPDTDVIEADIWIAYMLNLCAKHDIVLRVLEGTPSHDWKQSERFITIAKILSIPVDVKYIKELSIEYIKRFDINVLYVPDEWQNTTERTLEDVKDLLKAKGLGKVDYAIMHGAFTFQLPEIVKTHKHDPEAYLKIVKEFIFIGHIHNYSRYDRIIAQGSFDRLSHGEEEPKGHVRATITEDSRNVVFVENESAKIFKTIDCTGLTLEESIIKVDIEVEAIPFGSYVRIVCDSNNPILSNMDVLVRRYPLLIWSKLSRSTEEEIIIDNGVDESVYIPITITNENIKQLLLDMIVNNEISPDVLISAEKILDEVI